jgi:hypothetical protein
MWYFVRRRCVFFAVGDDVKKRASCLLQSGPFLLGGLLLCASLSGAREEDMPGHSIGKVSIKGGLILMELDDGALGNTNLFDLTGHTLRFTPEGSRYRVESGALRWDSDFGPELAGTEVSFQQFTFPFSNKRWNSFLVGTNGSIKFGTREKDIAPDPYGRTDGGVSLGRFDQLAAAASTLIDSAPAVCVFLKPRMSGPHYVKELPDRAVVTWDLTEPFGNLLDFTWFKTINRFQAVLHRDGSIEMSYQELAAKDAIVAVYPAPSGQETTLATITAEVHPPLPPHLDVQRVKLSILDGTLLRVTFETRGPVPSEGDRTMEGFGYRVDFDATDSRHGRSSRTVTWFIEGMKNSYNPNGGPGKYFVSGAGVSPQVKINGNSISVQGVVPAALGGAEQVKVSSEVTAGDHAKVVERLFPRTVQFSAIRSPEVHFSSLTRKDGPFAAVYESFHYLALPRPQDLSCTIIQGLGDKFDFLAYYSDFRFDNQEASTPSDGPLQDNVTGIGQTQHFDPESRCTQGRFQLGFAQPVYVGSNEMQERPPEGAPVGSVHDITSYTRQLAEGSPDKKSLPYNYAMSHLGHEVAHRWAAYVSAKVNGETISLGPWPHWARELQAPVAFPYQRPTEASTMGGGVWQDNFDGTYTQLHDGYFVPATGYSYLDLYLMGLIPAAEVPDFFLLKHLVPVGKDENGHLIFKAERTKVTIQDVIAQEGPRLPDVDRSQRKFNTGIVVVVGHGQSPSLELIERANGIRQQWIDYWETTTGHRASMTANPR